MKHVNTKVDFLLLLITFNNYIIELLQLVGSDELFAFRFLSLCPVVLPLVPIA